MNVCGVKGAPYKNLAAGVEWKVIDVIGQAENRGAIEWTATIWFRKIDDGRN
jgi:hypothetical protein